VTATTFNEPPQGQDTAQTEQSQPLDGTEPRTDDARSTREAVEGGTSADEGRQDGLVGAIKPADERQGCGARQEGLAAPDDAPTQPHESHRELGSENKNKG